MAKIMRQAVKRRAGAAAASPRRRKITKSQGRRLAKEKAKKTRLVSSFQLVKLASGIFKEHYKALGKVLLLYLVLNIVFASGLSGITNSISDIKTNLEAGGNKLLDGFASVGTLIGSAGASGSSSGSILQAMLVIVESLAIIWALRQLLAGKTIHAKDAYYLSMTPLIPFILILLVIFVQFLPLLLGVPVVIAILNAIFNPSAVLTFTALVFFAALAVWSFYLVSSSVIALYIVTLPGIQPLQALRSAKNLVKFKRWLIMRRLLFLPVFVVVVIALIMVPLILYAQPIAPIVFFCLSMVAILFIHTYLYSLYRGLIDGQ